MKSRLHKFHGFSLIELLVSMVIMLVVSGAVLALYSASRQTVRTQSGVSRMNERFNLLSTVVARDVRHSGHAGCPVTSDNRVARVDSLEASGATATPVVAYNTNIRLLNYGHSDAPSNAKSGSPVLELTTAADGGVHLASATTTRFTNTTPILLRGNPGIAQPSLTVKPMVLISDCQQMDHVEVVALNTNPWSIQTKSPLGWNPSSDARVSAVVKIQYYAATVAATPTSRATTTIFRRVSSPDSTGWLAGVPLVNDIENFSMMVDLDTDKDWDTDATVNWTSVTDPKQIMAIRFRYELNEGAVATSVDGTKVARTVSPWVTIRGRAI